VVGTAAQAVTSTRAAEPSRTGVRGDRISFESGVNNQINGRFELQRQGTP
jgi:hypothetical protein